MQPIKQNIQAIKVRMIINKRVEDHIKEHEGLYTTEDLQTLRPI